MIEDNGRDGPFVAMKTVSDMLRMELVVQATSVPDG